MALTGSRVGHQPDIFQQEGIACRDSGVRIVAPAGSGKTETLARRVAARIAEGIDPKRILILTFDTNARKSLDGFIRDAVPRGRGPVVWTLNQCGKEILRTRFPHEHHTIEQAADTRAMKSHFQTLANDLSVLEWDGVRRPILDVFDALKNQGYHPGNGSESDVMMRWLRREYLRLPDLDESATLDDFWGMPSGVVSTDAYAAQIQRVIDLYVEHDRYCRERGIMSLTDQKSRAFASLQSNHRIRQEVRASYDEVIVDECQDINRLDACLIWAIVGEKTTLVLAGDDDQTLYEFRNAHSLYLRDPERFFTDRAFTTIHLNINYRSPETILAAANALIRHNIERIEKSPQSGVAEAGEIRLLQAHSTAEEGRQLVLWIRDQLGQNSPVGFDRKLRDIAVLCHDDAMLKGIESALRSAGIPVFNDDRRRGPLVSEGLEVLTFRKAKGRQWPIVILPNSSDRVLPDDQRLREGRLESVRRMYYVAMTRATRVLVISYVRAGDVDVIHRTAAGEVVSTNGASRFLFEAGLVGQEPVEEPTVQASFGPVGTEVVTIPGPLPPVGGDPKPAVMTDDAPERVQVIVQPVPDPDPALLAPKRRRATKPWELRQPERHRLMKAVERWETGDYEYALMDSWKVVESILKRVVTLPSGDRDDRMVRIIDRAVEIGHIEPDWGQRLHRWRRVRNKMGAHLEAEDRHTAWDAVSLTPDFLAYLADRVAPKQVNLETHDEYVARLTRLVERIESGQPLPRTGKPLKAIRFDPAREALDMLPFQFLMILRDIRFYIPEDYRWIFAPVMGRFLVDTLGGMPVGVKPRGSHGTGKFGKPDQDRVYWRLGRLLENETRGDDPSVLLRMAVEDALKIGNGNFHAGLKLNPKFPRQ